MGILTAIKTWARTKCMYCAGSRGNTHYSPLFCSASCEQGFGVTTNQTA